MVYFTTILIHECRPRVGDSPLVSSGVPIALGYKVSERLVDVNDFERARRHKREHGANLLLSKEERVEMLLAEGYPPKEIYLAALDASIDRERIMNSRSIKQWDKFTECFEITTRKFTKLLRVRKGEKPTPRSEQPQLSPISRRVKAPSAA